MVVRVVIVSRVIVKDERERKKKELSVAVVVDLRGERFLRITTGGVMKFN